MCDSLHPSRQAHERVAGLFDAQPTIVHYAPVHRNRPHAGYPLASARR